MQKLKSSTVCTIICVKQIRLHSSIHLYTTLAFQHVNREPSMNTSVGRFTKSAGDISVYSHLYGIIDSFTTPSNAAYAGIIYSILMFADPYPPLIPGNCP